MRQQKKNMRYGNINPFYLACVGLGVVTLFAWAFQTGTLAASNPESPERERNLFGEKCAVCHTIGGGDKAGPDLKGVAERRDREWLVRWLIEPDKMIARGDPVATRLLQKYNNIPMPNLGLTEQEAVAILDFMTVEGGPTVAQKTGGPQALTQGDVGTGKNLFMGAKQFKNGGAPCLACHGIAGMGAFGGGVLGPDLTETYMKLGEAIITWPRNVPPMQLIYSTKPLTPEEEAHLLAFFRSAPVPGRPISAAATLAGIGALGAVVLMLAVHLVWRGRLREVRRQMMAR